jgi:hypothetical protein
MASTPKTPKKRVAKKTAPATAKSAVVDATKTIEKIIKDKDHKEKPEVKEHKIELKEHKNEVKEHKNEKIEIKEHTKEKIEIKEKPEIKEHGKIEKNEIKEHKFEKLEKEHGKEGGKIETKDGGKENVKIEIKEQLKEHTKDVIDKLIPENPKDLVENPGRPVDTGDPAVNADLAQRVANLEGQLATFISNANRPDLSTGALKNEAAPAKPKKK